MRILNKHSADIPANAVYVGRPSMFGNPFELGPDRTRDQACDQFKSWILLPEQAELRSLIRKELYGKDLVCWCSPKRCHAETLRDVALSLSDAQLVPRTPTTDGF